MLDPEPKRLRATVPVLGLQPLHLRRPLPRPVGEEDGCFTHHAAKFLREKRFSIAIDPTGDVFIRELEHFSRSESLARNNSRRKLLLWLDRLECRPSPSRYST